MTSILPDIGSTGGGTQVKVEGSGFQNNAIVTIGGTLANSWISGGGFYFSAPAHAAGTVDVAVTVNGAIGRLVAGYTYASPGSFDFNGDWAASAYLEDETSLPMNFTIQNNVLANVSCGTSGMVIPLPAPSASNGQFAFTGNGGVTVSGRILSASQASGTITLPPCSAAYWIARK